ncbi:guanylyl and adenylyl cyclase family member, partial [Volvox carteri f. nagariensis]
MFTRGKRELALAFTSLLTVLWSLGARGQQLVINETSFWCADVAAKAFLASCNAASADDVLARVVARKYAACIENNGTQLPRSLPLVQIMVPLNLYTTYHQLADNFTAATAQQLAVVPVDVDQLQQEALFEYSNNLSRTHHAWIMYLDSYYPLEQLSAISDLTNLTAASTAAQAVWKDLPAGFQHLSLSYGDVPPGPDQAPKMLSLPLDASTPLMYYLPHVLARNNLSVPRTWSEVLYVARKINGTDINDDGLPEYAVCFKPDPDCSYASALGMVLAPYLQYKGTAQGAFLHPSDLTPLFGSPGALAALEGEDCLDSASARAFLEGECALAFGWGDLFKSSELFLDSNSVKSRYAISVLPGSEVVYDRDAMVRKDCTAKLCPYGLNDQPEQIVHQEDNSIVYVNRAPYLPYTGLVGVVSADIDPAQQQTAFDFLVFLAEHNRELALSRSSFVLPYRTSLLNSSDTSLLDAFVAAGFDSNATLAYMNATLATLYHSNLVPGPIIPRAEALRALFGLAAANLSYAQPNPELVSEQLQTAVQEQVVDYDSSTGWRMQLRSAYWNFIDYLPEVPRGDPDGDGGREMDIPAVSLAVPVASALVVLVASTLYEFKKHRQHRSLFGKVVAPGPFEDTTLLVTDIQDSTALWEMLPSNVMDRAIKEHHTCLRKLLLKHSGYESATGIDTDKRASLIADGADAAGSLMALPRTNSGLSNKSTSEDTSSPQASNALSAPGSESNTFITACQASWKEANATTPNNVLIFRGLRVRMGMHTGITNEADVAYNKAAARMQYSGEILQYAKAVSDAAAGGMILLSEATYRRLPMERLWDKAMVMHVGEYKLKDDLPVLSLYQVTGRRLMGRLGYLSGMRFKEQLSKGVYSAPLGAVAMAYVGIVGTSELLAWNESVTREAMAQLHSCVSELSHKWGGYLVQATGEQVHVVFAGAADALSWALAVHQALMELPWPEPLLEHLLGEELIVGDVVVFRGLRVKTGVDVGHAVGEVDALTGRICYRGKVVARAARIMQNASPNQVLASGEAWAAAMASSPGLLQVRGIVGGRIGPFKLRGVADRIDIIQVRLQRADVAGADGWAQDLQQGGGAGGGGGAAAMAPAEAAEVQDDSAAAGGGGVGNAAAAAPLRSGTASNLRVHDGAVAAAGTEDASVSGKRAFGFLSRGSRGDAAQALTATASAHSARQLELPPGGAGDGGAAPAAAPGLPLPASGGSPRLFGSLKLFGSTRAQSFTGGLLHRMANSSKSRGGGGGGTSRGSRASGFVDTSAVSISAAAAT